MVGLVIARLYSNLLMVDVVVDLKDLVSCMYDDDV